MTLKPDARSGRTAPSFIITFLGTGSGTPTAERNLACVAAQRLGELFLFDCGEAAQIQYRRAGLGFAPLRAIFISHLHGDHVTGLMGFLMSLGMADRSEPLAVYGPAGLEEYVACNRKTLGTRFSYGLEVRELGGLAQVLETETYRIYCAPLDHRIECLGYAVEELPRPGRFDLAAARELGIPPGPLYGQLQRGRPVALPDGRVIEPDHVLGPPRPGTKIAYCTDTRPCETAVALAAGADLLIHEGTFAADMARDARRKGHSTVADAARVAARAGVSQLAITHISPRYGDTRLLLEQARAIFPNTIIARDLMRVEVFPREEGEGELRNP